MKYYFITIAISREDKNTNFDSSAINEHPFVYFNKITPMFGHKLNIVFFAEITEYEYSLFNKKS